MDDDGKRFKTISIDYECYGHYLENAGLNDAQKREILDALWTVIVGFVDLGFEVRPGTKSLDGDSGSMVALQDQFSKTKSIEAAACALNGRGAREES